MGAEAPTCLVRNPEIPHNVLEVLAGLDRSALGLSTGRADGATIASLWRKASNGMFANSCVGGWEEDFQQQQQQQLNQVFAPAHGQSCTHAAQASLHKPHRRWQDRRRSVLRIANRAPNVVRIVVRSASVQHRASSRLSSLAWHRQTSSSALAPSCPRRRDCCVAQSSPCHCVMLHLPPAIRWALSA